MARTLIHIIALLCLLFCHASLGGEVNVKHLYKQKWIQMESDNFSVLSNANASKTAKMLQELEDFNYFVPMLLGFKQRNAFSQKFPVILAKNKDSLASMGVPKDYAGVFIKGSEQVIFARVDGFKSSKKGRGSWGRSVILHELSHLLVDNTKLQLASPPWYTEGIAEYFGTYVRKKNKIILGDMSILQHRYQSMVANIGGKFDNIDSESLFKTTKRDLNISAKNDRKHVKFLNRFYTRSVSVVHYFNADNKRRKDMYTYLHLLHKGYTVDEAFTYVFDMTFSELDEKVNAYIDGKFVMARTFDIGKNGLQFPKAKTQVVDISKDQSMDYLYRKISLFSDNFLGFGNRDKMNADFEKSIPGFFSE